MAWSMAPRPFPRRCYRGPVAPLSDLLWIVARAPRALAVGRGRRVSPELRERLMLAVTEVNGCRYCSWVHTREALRAGLSDEEVRQLVGGDIGGATEGERPALIYAQHWASTDGRPEPDARARALALYGEERLQDYEMAMRLIRVGNLWGNTLDCVLYGISGGRWGAVAR
jgi:AhpD family alkylhydroperoxidase